MFKNMYNHKFIINVIGMILVGIILKVALLHGGGYLVFDELFYIFLPEEIDTWSREIMGPDPDHAARYTDPTPELPKEDKLSRRLSISDIPKTELMEAEAKPIGPVTKAITHWDGLRDPSLIGPDEETTLERYYDPEELKPVGPEKTLSYLKMGVVVFAISCFTVLYVYGLGSGDIESCKVVAGVVTEVVTTTFPSVTELADPEITAQTVTLSLSPSELLGSPTGSVQGSSDFSDSEIF